MPTSASRPGAGGAGATIPSTTAILVGDGAGNAAAASETGTGNAVRATSPTLVTPALGTPTGGNGTNLTNLNASSLSSGTVPTARLATGTANSTTFLRGDQTWATVASSSGANPTASVGLTAVNGVATTFLRSDGAPALDQSIAPTWTGQHTFAAGTITTSKPLALTQTWNASGTTFKGLSLTITDTASAAGSLPLEVLGGSAGTTSLLSLSKGGTLNVGDPTGFNSVGLNLRVSSGVGAIIQVNGSAAIQLGSATNIAVNSLGFTSNPANSSPDAGLFRNAAGVLEVNNGSAGVFRDIISRQFLTDKTITSAGTTGAQTINKGAGTIRIAAAGTSVVLTNSLITVNSILAVALRTVDTTAKSAVYVCAAGSVTFTLNAGATSEVEIGWAIQG